MTGTYNSVGITFCYVTRRMMFENGNT